MGLALDPVGFQNAEMQHYGKYEDDHHQLTGEKREGNGEKRTCPSQVRFVRLCDI